MNDLATLNDLDSLDFSIQIHRLIYYSQLSYLSKNLSRNITSDLSPSETKKFLYINKINKVYIKKISKIQDLQIYIINQKNYKHLNSYK